MTIAEINAQINSYQSAVITTANHLTALSYNDVNKNLQYAKSVLDLLFTTSTYYVQSHLDSIKYVLYYLIRTVESQMAQYSAQTHANKNNLEAILKSFNMIITDYVQAALVQIDAKNSITLSAVDARITTAVNAAMSPINAKMTSFEATINSQLSSVTTELTTDIDSLESTVNDLETTFFEEIGLKANEIYSTVSDWVGGLWQGIEAAYQWATDQVNAMYDSIYTWAAEKFDHLSSIVSVGFTNIGLLISNKIASVMTAIDAAKAQLTSFINSSVDALQLVIDYSVETINNAMTDLSISLDWRFNFFNIALALPELSILQVLTRPDEFFDQYKSYWQALIARILEDKY